MQSEAWKVRTGRNVPFAVTSPDARKNDARTLERAFTLSLDRLAIHS
jgi:hypothetical protein